MRTLPIVIALALCASLGFTAAAQPPSTPLHHSISDTELQWSPCPDIMPEGCQLTVLHGDPAQRNADVLIRFPPQAHITRHWHTSAERMILIVGELEVDYDERPPVVLAAGDYAYGPPRLPHSAHCRSSEPCYLFIAFEAPVDAHAGGPEAAE